MATAVPCGTMARKRSNNTRSGKARSGKAKPSVPARAVKRAAATPRTPRPPRTPRAPRTPRTQSTAARNVYAGDPRIGHGWDLHRLEPLMSRGGGCEGRPLVVGGVLLATADEFDRGPVARSDGDVLLHAVTDALLGALALPDIGQLFPDTDDANEGRDSRDFLLAAMAQVRSLGFRVVNLDATVVLQRPKLSPHKSEIINALAEMLEVDPGQVNVKGKTHEKVDAIGEGRAIEAHAVVLLAAR